MRDVRRIGREVARAAWIGLGALACAQSERAPAVQSASQHSTQSPLDTTLTGNNGLGDDQLTSKRSTTTPATAAIVLDTARGIVRRVGADPLSRLTLFPTAVSDSDPLALSGAMQSGLAAAEGLEVMITGTRTAERAMDVAPGGFIVFDVRRFVVRAVDGVQAHDGILRRLGGRMYLETSPGTRRPIVHLPNALQDQVGARIFLVGSLERAPIAFGVLRPR